MVDTVVLESIRRDSLSKHPGATKKYGDKGMDTCIQVIINRNIDSTSVKVIFEEGDGFGHGLNVPPGWLTEDHISPDRAPCPRCGGAGKLQINGVDCIECKGTGKIIRESNIKVTLQ